MFQRFSKGIFGPASKARVLKQTPAHYSGLVLRQCFGESIQQRFDYGQNSTVFLRMGDRKINAKIEAIWDDWTDIDVSLLDSESLNSHNISVKDNQKFIELAVADQGKADSGTRDIKLMIPEYSSLDLEFLGSIEQRDTKNIDSKMKGSLRVVSTDPSPDSKIVFKRVKTENGIIEIDRSDLFFKSYWESKVGRLIKKGAGIIDIKRFGVSYNFRMEYHDTNFKIKTVFTNPLDKATQPETDHRLKIDCTNSRTEYGMFRGSAAINMAANSYFVINDGSIDALDVTAS